MAVTRSTLHIERLDPATQFVHVLSNLLSQSECEEVIESYTRLEPSNIVEGTIRTRARFENPALASLLWSRISYLYKDDRIKDEDGDSWKAKGLNIHFRLSKYDAGGKFTPHFDYRRLTDIDTQSFMSVNIYLNDVSEENKGATRILQYPFPGYRPTPRSQFTVLGKIQPVQGTASVFRDTLWHDGEELLAGEKYLLRTDLMYEREGEFDFDRICQGLDWAGKADKAMNISYALDDGGNQDEADSWRARALEYNFFK